MEKSEYQNIYDNEETHWWYRSLHELVLSVIQTKTRGSKLSLLDTGCGTGGLLKLMKKFGTTAGVDFSELAIELCRKRGGGHVEVGNLTEVDLGEEKYDVVTSLDVLVHRAIDNDELVLGKFYRALKSNGLLIMNLAAFDCLRREHDKIVHGVRRYRRPGLKIKLEQAGFNILLLSYRCFALFFVILAVKGGRKLLHRQESSDLNPIPSFFNRAFLHLLRIENKIVLMGFPVPLGASLFVVARKGSS